MSDGELWAWRIGLVALWAVAIPGGYFALRLLVSSEQDRRVVEEADGEALLALIVRRNTRAAWGRLLLVVYFLAIVPVFLALPVRDGQINFPVQVGVGAAVTNLIWGSYQVWASIRDYRDRQQVLHANRRGQ